MKLFNFENYYNEENILFTTNKIEAENISKKYGSKFALSELNLSFNKGMVEGVIGPNGSGKTTALRIISGIIKYDSGLIKIDGNVIESYEKFARKNIAYVPESPVLYETLTGNEYCDLYSGVRGANGDEYQSMKERIADALDLVDIMDRPIGMLSFGTKQKIAILSALCSNPEVLIFDESLNGLDPTSIIVVKEVIREMIKNGHFVIFSTHILDVAEIICNRVQILDSGRKILEGSMEELKGDDGEGGFLERLFLQITGKEDIIEKAKKLGDSLFRSEE